MFEESIENITTPDNTFASNLINSYPLRSRCKAWWKLF